MKGCGFALLKDFLLYLVVAGGFAASFMAKGAQISDAFAPAALCGALLWIGLKFLIGINQPIREKRMLANREERPEDGKICAISGTIHASAPLRAPLSGQPCVAFRYTISAVVGSGKHRTIAPMYEGVAVTPATIRTNSGSYRLLAVPTFDFPSELLDSDAALRNAREHVEATKFEKPRPPRSKSRLQEEWSDDDGSYRYEVDHAGSPVALDECDFDEHVVKQGEEITAFGRYSLERGGLVPDENWATHTRIMKGSVPLIIDSLRRRVRNYVILGTLFSAAGVGLFMMISRSQ